MKYGIELVDFFFDEHQYNYIYAVIVKSFLKKRLLKLTFKSNLPHYWWTEIQKIITEEAISIESLIGSAPVNIKIGTLTGAPFSDADLAAYGNDRTGWKVLRKEASEKQVQSLSKTS